MERFTLSDTEELYVLVTQPQYCKEASQKVEENLSMTDEQWVDLHHDEGASSSQRFINCSKTVTELETIAIDS